MSVGLFATEIYALGYEGRIGAMGLVEEDILSFYILFINTNPILYSHFCR